MFVGHLAVAFGAKAAAPKAPLSALIAASFGLDLIWPVFLLGGVETVRIAPGITAFTPLDFVHYPWSHSLVMTVVWGALAGLLAFVFLKSIWVSILIGAVVLSHWVLDLATHRPDLPISLAGPKVGLGLWNSIPGTLIVESSLLVLGVALYVRSAKPRDPVGPVGTGRVHGPDLGQPTVVSSAAERDRSGGGGTRGLALPVLGSLDRTPPNVDSRLGEETTFVILAGLTGIEADLHRGVAYVGMSFFP